MIKAIIFDLDNTLIDFMKMKRSSINAAIYAMIEAGLPIRKEDAVDILFKLYDKYGIEDNTIFQKFLKETIGEVDYKILSAGIVAYRRIREHHLDPYPNVRPTLKKLKESDYKLAIVSDAPRLKAWLRLTYLGLTNYFDIVVTFDDTNKKKPSPEPFRFALEKLKVKPEEVIIIGDDIKKDIAGGKKLGMLTVFARYGDTFFHKPENGYQKPDYVIDDIKELLDVLKNG